MKTPRSVTVQELADIAAAASQDADERARKAGVPVAGLAGKAPKAKYTKADGSKSALRAARRIADKRA